MNSHRNLRFTTFVFLIILVALVTSSPAVTTGITRHATSADFLKGKTENVVISSRGTIELGNSWETLVPEFKDVWSINSVIVAGPTTYIGTSPNGGIYQYTLGSLKKIYPSPDNPQQNQPLTSQPQPQSPNDPNTPTAEDPNAPAPKEDIENEHIFAMTTDLSGRLLAGISGKNCRLIRFEKGLANTVFEPNDAKYIFALAVDEAGFIYLGTGPQGKIYRLDSLAAHPELIYTAVDKNILSLAVGKNGRLFAGTDGRGIIYDIDVAKKTAKVLYDSDQPEITSLLYTSDGILYAAATSAKIMKVEKEFMTRVSLPGRPDETEKRKEIPLPAAGSGLELKVANTTKTSEQTAPKPPQPPMEKGKTDKASLVYKITGDGFVQTVFSTPAVFFSLARVDAGLYIGSGNSGELFSVDESLEQDRMIYEDKTSSQITAMAVTPDGIYLGTANPAKLISLGKGFAKEGVFKSSLIDAGQPAKWGNLQMEGDIPTGCRILASSRSGNVSDINDPTFSPWTDLVEVTQPVQLDCPIGRFCQYKLVLKTADQTETPVIREVAVAHTVPNIAPVIQSVDTARIEGPGKEGFFKIGYNARDDNGDKLIYKIEFRKTGRGIWIKLKDEVEENNFAWDSKTVEDGRYEIRVTASDERGNTPATKLTNSRISELVTVDNTPPVIEGSNIEATKTSVTLKFKVVDALSVIGQVFYSVDSSEKWQGALPEDLVYDSTEEDFVITIPDLEAGEHVIALKFSDDVGSTAYKSFDVVLPGI